MTEEIIQYIEGKMNPEEKQTFEARMESDPELAELVKYTKAAQKASDGFIEAEIYNTIQSFNRTVQTRKATWNKLWKWLAFIALITLILTGIFYLNKNQDQTEKEPVILADNYTQPIWPLERSDNNSISDAVRLHLGSQTDQALSLLLDKDEVTITEQYWAAEIMIDAGRYRDALAILSGLNMESEALNKRIDLLKAYCVKQMDGE